MNALFLALMLAQWGPSPAVGRTAESVLTVECPPQAELWIDGSKASSTGRRRIFATPALPPGRYRYELRCLWRGQEKIETVEFDAGESISTRFDFEVIEQGSNYGVDVDKLSAGPPRYWNQHGVEMEAADAHRLVTDRLADDSLKPWLVIVTAEDSIRKRVLDDLARAPALAPWAGKLRVQSYRPDEWESRRYALAGRTEFQGTALIAQPAVPAGQRTSARFLFRYDGPEVLAAFLANKQPEPSPGPFPLPDNVNWNLVFLAAAIAGLILLLSKGGNHAPRANLR